jgi:hypothetical protein
LRKYCKPGDKGSILKGGLREKRGRAIGKGGRRERRRGGGQREKEGKSIQLYPLFPFP